MRRNGGVETGRDRTELARDAGFGRVSLWSVLAGTLAAYGAFAVAFPVVTAVASAAGVDTDLSTNDWRVLGAGAGVTVAVTLFASYLVGGYAAGRAARRQGLLHGLLVFVLSVAVAAGVGALVGVLTDADGDRLLADLRDLGVPTAADEWRRVATVAGLASLGAMLAGSLLGGWRGETWHGRLLARALDPEVGHESRLRRLAAEADDRHGAAEDRVRRARGPLDAPPSSRDTAVLAAPVDEVRTERVVVTHEPLGDATTTTQTIDLDQLRGGAEGTAGPADARRDRP